MNLLSLFLGVITLVFSWGTASASDSEKMMQNCFSVSKHTCEVAHALGRGINFGNMLEAPREGDWGVRVEPRFIDLVDGLFSTVRLPVRWSNHASKEAQATIDSSFFERVENVVDELLSRNLYVILNMHHYSQLFGQELHINEFGVDSDVVEERFLNMWRQIAYRFRNKSDKLLFELLNEPHGSLNAEKWNVLSAKALKIVRETNPDRIVMIGPTYYNNVRDLPKLKVPKDQNIIVTIHNYSPFFFTHQGVTYLPMDMPTGVTCCNESQKKEIVGQLNFAMLWSQEHGYPLYLGEFGTYNKADMQSRENYASFVREELEKRGIGWAYWELAASFGLYDPKKGAWREPLKKALLGH
ncbi:glycoside hydrolase family 5 protein [Thiomicrorhabdus sp.]|uniref:glycoside hydrolase family 5 protein n=1 Tax=Thiomicrorhabdus sp. TaxID=2039724 RepID=UPI00356AAE7B